MRVSFFVKDSTSELRAVVHVSHSSALTACEMVGLKAKICVNEAGKGHLSGSCSDVLICNGLTYYISVNSS